MSERLRPLAAAAILLLCAGIAGAHEAAPVPDGCCLQLRLADGSVVPVRVRSDLEMRRLRRNRTTGRARTVIDARPGGMEPARDPGTPGPLFEIHAPGAVASVRG
jgi:hypothetical protein